MLHPGEVQNSFRFTISLIKKSVLKRKNMSHSIKIHVCENYTFISSSIYYLTPTFLSELRYSSIQDN